MPTTFRLSAVPHGLLSLLPLSLWQSWASIFWVMACGMPQIRIQSCDKRQSEDSRFRTQDSGCRIQDAGFKTQMSNTSDMILEVKGLKQYFPIRVGFFQKVIGQRHVIHCKERLLSRPRGWRRCSDPTSNVQHHSDPYSLNQFDSA